MNYNYNSNNNVGGGNPNFGREVPAAAPVNNNEFIGWNRVHQRQDRLNVPVWGFLREQRAQAGGNRMMRQRPQFVAREVQDNHQGQLAGRDIPNHVVNNQVNNQMPFYALQQQLRRNRVGRNRRDARQSDNEPSRPRRGKYEYDMREDECWRRIDENIQQKTRSFSSAPASHDSFYGFESLQNIHIPSDAEVCAMLRSDDQIELIMEVRKQLADPKTSEFNFRKALEKMDMHLRNNDIECQMIEEAINQLIDTSDKLGNELNNIDDLLAKVSGMTI